jgi:hypothetical protein
MRARLCLDKTAIIGHVRRWHSHSLRPFVRAGGGGTSFRNASRYLGGLCFYNAARLLGGLCFRNTSRYLGGLCFRKAARYLGGLCFYNAACVLSGPTLCMLGSGLGEPPAPSIIANHASTTVPSPGICPLFFGFRFPCTVKRGDHAKSNAKTEGSRSHCPRTRRGCATDSRRQLPHH